MLLQTAEANLDSLAISPSLQKIYWADTRRGRIGRCNLDGSNPEIRFIPDLNNPNHLVIDESAKLLYWIETKSQQSSTIRRAGLDGLEPTTPVELNTKEEQHQIIRGLAIDTKGQRLYWIQSENHPGGYLGRHSQETPATSKIMSSDLLGSNRQDLQVPDLCQPNSMVFDKRRQTLFWNQSASYRHDVYITMNAPVEFSNPVNGQTYRLFQESFSGPWKPGSSEYEQMILPTSEKEELYLSVLTVNADPGRWIRNLGCLFVVLGIATMFYMRAYFFKPRRNTQSKPPTPENSEATQPTS
jgi:sugar lactone lactonase YvrE